MKTKVMMSAIGLSIKENEGTDGKKFYKMSIDQDGEAGSLSMSEEAYKMIAASFKKYSPVSLTCEFNDQYKTLRIIGVSQR